MQPAVVVLVSAALAGAVAAVVTIAMREDAPAATAGASREQLAALQREVETLRDALGKRAAAPLEPAAAAASPQRVAVPEVPEDLIAAALARYLEKHGAPGTAPAAGATSRPQLDVEATFTELRGKNPWTHQAAWRKVTEAGKWDEVIARFEQNARENPTPDKHVELAQAYLARSAAEPEKYELGIEADKCFDRALELDGKHWEARFTKAMCYTFWPDFLGKKKEAIAHFETLLTQQEEGPAQPQFAQTYVFLGNMHEQRGDAAKAREVWARGGRLYPDHEELQGKLRAR